MRGLVVALALCMTVPALAGNVPLPRAKPVAAAETLVAAIPLPRPKPGRPVVPEVVEPDNTGPPAGEIADKLDDASGGKSRWPRDQVADGKLACVSLLAGLDIIWRPDTPIGAPGGCGTPMPIAVSEIAGVRIKPVATVNCAMAAALHQWISGSLKPAARKSMGAALTEISNASSYACRRRNNASTGKLSEHAKANAFDISEFRFGKGTVVNVKGDYSGLLQAVGVSGRGNFLRAARTGACGSFNTVLGPGSDAFHKDHFHVDLMPLRPGRYKMCR